MNTSEEMVSDKIVLALDAHGGDFGPAVTIPAALDVLALHSNLEVLLCGISEDMQPVLSKFKLNMP